MGETESTSCQACGEVVCPNYSQAVDFDSGEQAYTLAHCPRCGLGWISPQMSPRDLGQYYCDDYYGGETKKFFSAMEYLVHTLGRFKAKAIINQINKQGITSKTPNVLDIGCGRGVLLNSLAHYGVKCSGVEPSVFPKNDTAIKIFQQDFLDVSLQDGSFDVVIMWHVFEHLLDPQDVLDKIHRILRPNGLLIIAVPNFSSTQSQWFMGAWFHLDLPRHVYHYSCGALRQILKRHYFKLRHLHTWCIDQSIYGFIQSALNKTGWFRGNELYSFLKSSGEKTLSVKTLLQLSIALILLPAAMVEFVYNGLSKRGSCIIVYASRQSIPTKHQE